MSSTAAPETKWVSQRKNAKAREQWGEITRRVHALPPAAQAAYARKLTAWVQESIQHNEAPVNLYEFCFSSESILLELEPPVPPTRLIRQQPKP